MRRRLLTILGVAVGVVITAILVAASIWPVISEVETGETPEYPEIRPQYYTAEPGRVFDATRDAVESMPRARISSSNRNEYRLECVRSSYVFGFEFDLTVSVESVTQFVTRVHVASRSRFGRGDLGQNARNIRRFFRALDERLGAVKFDPSRLQEGAPAASRSAPDPGETETPPP